MTFISDFTSYENIDYDFMSAIRESKENNSEESLEELLNPKRLYNEFLANKNDPNNNNYDSENVKDKMAFSENQSAELSIGSPSDLTFDSSIKVNTNVPMFSSSSYQSSCIFSNSSLFELNDSILPLDSNTTISSNFLIDSIDDEFNLGTKDLNNLIKLTNSKMGLTYQNTNNINLQTKKMNTEPINITILPNGKHEATIDSILLPEETINDSNNDNDNNNDNNNDFNDSVKPMELEKAIEPNLLNIKKMNNKQKKNLKQDKPIQCPNCGKNFQSMCHWKRHHESVHLNVRNFECTRCGIFFKRKDQLIQHLNRKNQCDMKT